MNIVECDLFEINEGYDLAHCISHDCALGAGIALEFRKRYPNMPSDIKRYLMTNKINKPCTIEYDVNGRKIYNLITKSKYFEKPTYETLSIALSELKEL